MDSGGDNSIVCQTPIDTAVPRVHFLDGVHLSLKGKSYKGKSEWRLYFGFAFKIV